MSTVSTMAMSSVWASIEVGQTVQQLAPAGCGPRAAHAGNASTAAPTAASAVAASPRATSASFHDQSSGDRSSNVDGEQTRSPPIRWSGETAHALHQDCIRGFHAGPPRS